MVLKEWVKCTLIFQDEISAANGKVIVITFGLREGALRWLDDVKSPFPFLMDHHRKVGVILQRNVYARA